MQAALDSAYIKDLSTNEVLTFGYIPEEISDTKAANYAQIEIPGRSEPVFGYVSSGPRELSLHLKFIAGIGQTKYAALTSDGETPSNSALVADNTLTVLTKTRWLQSLMYPDYSTSDYTLPPHQVLLSIGLLIKSVCIIPSVNVTYKAPYDEYLLPFIVEVDLSLYEVNKVPLGYQDVRLSNVILQPITAPLMVAPGAMISPITISPTPTVVAPVLAVNPTIPWGQLKINNANMPTIWNGQKYINLSWGSIYADLNGKRWIVRGVQSNPSSWWIQTV